MKSTKSGKNKHDEQYRNIEVAPLSPNTFSISTDEHGTTIVSFAWIPPEARSEFHILTRIAMTRSMAKALGEYLLEHGDTKKTREAKPISQRKVNNRRKTET